MDATAKLFILLGSTNAALAVILGAFGAHALKTKISEQMLGVFQTGIQYHFYHALGLLLLGILALNLPSSNWLKASGLLMLMGILLFSGSLYALALSNIRWLGAITPLGGTAFILAWCSLVVALLTN
ncbi:MAG: DUF423 domain-containing protein [Gammaproteobacteria bacterium]|nr:DUF423 domain-containing protein [Gammaproteobacteria bacterium]